MSDREIKTDYNKTKIGWIPEDWTMHKLDELIKTYSGGTPSRDFIHYYNGNIPWIKSGALNNKYITYAEERISQEGFENSSAKYVEPGTLLYALYGATAGIPSFTLIKATINQAILAIITNKKVEKEYLYFWFVNKKKSLLNKYTQGGQPNLSAQLVKSFIIPLPPLPEQKEIAEILSTRDQAIEKLNTLIEKKKQLKKGLMQQLLTGKSRLPGYTDEWMEYKFADIIQQVNRPIPFNDDQLYNLISVKRRSGGLFFRDSLYGHQILTKTLSEVKEGDFLISKMQIVHGASGLVSKEFVQGKISGSYISIVPKDHSRLSIKFFNLLSQMPYFYHLTYLASYGVHIEKMTFNFNLFLKSRIKLPNSLSEQNSIVSLLNNLTNEIKILELKLDLFEKQKKGLMQQRSTTYP